MTATSLFVQKLYALLASTVPTARSDQSRQIYRYIIDQLSLADDDVSVPERWAQANAIACSSDRVNLAPNPEQPLSRELRHPMSGASLQEREPDLRFSAAGTGSDEIPEIVQQIVGDADLELSEKLQRLLWWAWRFAPEQAMGASLDFLYPAHLVLPDNPIHSHNSTVSALVGAMFANRHHSEPPQTPYLLLFTFSPVQDFIKASRKFLDFWSGSYMLHYLSARLCWRIAEEYGPDAVITPSLWGQDIIDALLAKKYPDFKAEFKAGDPVTQFVDRESSSLSTAGFPNTITALVPGKDAAIALGQQLTIELKDTWQNIANRVKQEIKTRVIAHLSGEGLEETWAVLQGLFPKPDQDTYYRELTHLRQHGCWEWNGLWDAQIDNTWQPYFVAVPLGDPNEPMVVAPDNKPWVAAQNAIAQPLEDLPAAAERHFDQLNVGTWWGSLQTRLGRSIQAVKNTRNWSIPVSPGGRSSLSGQMSAVHPRFNYQKFQHGRGMAAGSMRLFWHLLPLVEGYKGVFDGSEQLNALELTKRLAWKHGGVAESLGLLTDELAADSESEYQSAYRDDYEILIRFPNQSSIAAAHFASHYPDIVDQYWKQMRKAIANSKQFSREAYHRFCSITHRPFQIPQADAALKEVIQGNHGYNGVMFSSKWLAEDMGLARGERTDAAQPASESVDDVANLREVVNQVHKQVSFNDSSPSDWWVLLLADGDGMGNYVNGRSLETYEQYLIHDLVNRTNIDPEAWNDLLETRKRMGPATHVGLNRALLDFSNRLVPHLMEHRYCGRVIYSGGDDVMAALPLADLPGGVRSLRAAWSGKPDPEGEFENRGDYWWAKDSSSTVHLPQRPLFTMGQKATMSMGIVIAHKSVPLPTVLESLWEAESGRAKKLVGSGSYKPKDGLCFRVIYGSGNTLEALMKGHLLELWWEMVRACTCDDEALQAADLSPVLNRLAEELPNHVAVTEDLQLCRVATEAILTRRDETLDEGTKTALLDWVDEWEQWAWNAQQTAEKQDASALGASISDLANLLKFSAFWVTRRRVELGWTENKNGAKQSHKLEVSHV